ncbi:MAG: glutamate--cysteine ligase [Deltaproteobacteria bacterium]|nr:MAG: glutamate--cysteine ligase [Deltaproteobacteria bacterium]
MSARDTLHLFEGFGIEIEYAIVERAGLDVCPIADRLIETEAGAPLAEIERGDAAWSNELALHVVEFKTNGPAASLRGLAARFQGEVTHANAQLAGLGARLMPTGMHPWMDPDTELRLWPHQHGDVYRAFQRIFDCRGHGWANLQSVHLNLPFAGDEEFGRLHAAVRLVLPLLPALAASSPLAEGRLSGALDTRLVYYARNAARVPSVGGKVIPEPVFTRDGYEQQILERIYADLAPLDAAGVLRHEWVNSRGCIARFDRSAIEIRLLDTQECPAADLAVAAAVAALVRALALEELSASRAQREVATERLTALLMRTICDADDARLDDVPYLRLLGWTRGPCTARDLWRQVVERCLAGQPGYDEWEAPLGNILDAGCLARRIRTRLAGDLRRSQVARIYADLCRCLETGGLFRARA